MNTRFLAVSLFAGSALVLAAGWGQPPAKKPGQAPDATPKQPEKKPVEQPATSQDAYVLGFKMKLIDGKEQNLEDYKGKVVVIVNVASQCGYTPQYEQLQKLYAAKKDLGLVILGFPANNFGGQEPGTNEEVARFCKDKYSVTFPMFEKISVKGDDQAPLYKKLTSQPAPVGGDPKWNFAKYVVDRSGRVVAHIDAHKSKEGIEPELIAKIDELLAKK